MNTSDTLYSENFQICYSQHYKSVLGVIFKMTRNIHTSEELAQDIFAKLFAKRIPLDPANPTTRAYLVKVSRNRALDYIRNERRRAEINRQMQFEEITLNRDFFEDVEQPVIEGEVISTFYDTLNELTPKEREIFFQRAVLQRRMIDICRELNTTRYIIRKVVLKTSNKLKEKLKGRFEETSP